MKSCPTCKELCAEIDSLKEQIRKLRKTIAGKDETPTDKIDYLSSQTTRNDTHNLVCAFSSNQLARYGRQMLVKEFGCNGQKRLSRARILIVGLGGLGSPVALHLASMGVGTLGLVDDDVVELSNLHRQILYDFASVGKRKTEVAASRLGDRNVQVQFLTYHCKLTPENAENIVSKFDVIIDCTDNSEARYALNDACVKCQLPLVVASALGLEGQVMVLNEAPDAPCYRCIYPQKSKIETNCNDVGVIGCLPGIIGSIQVMEAIKLVTRIGVEYKSQQIVYDAYTSRFKSIKLGSRRVSCACAMQRSAVGDLQSTHTHKCEQQVDDMLKVRAQRSISSPNSTPKAKLLGLSSNMDAKAFYQFRTANLLEIDGESHAAYVLLDVRPSHEFDIIHFSEAINIPLPKLQSISACGLSQVLEYLGKFTTAYSRSYGVQPPTLVICRRGNASILATQALLNAGIRDVKNIIGGYTEYGGQVSPAFQMY